MITLLNKFDDGYIIGEKDVLEIVSHYIEEDNLEEFIKDVSFDNNYEGMGAYKHKANIIILNNENILKFCYCIWDKLMKLYNIDEKYCTYFINFYYLYVLFHEIEHAKQNKKYESLDDKSVLYAFLYGLCSRLEGNNQFYDKNHDLFPTEIEADNNGLLKSYNLLSYTKLPVRETKVLYLQYLVSLQSNYERINRYRVLTPIEKLYNDIKIDNNIKVIDMNLILKLLDKSKLSKIERFNLGVCITPKEFDSISRERIKIYRAEKGFCKK